MKFINIICILISIILVSCSFIKKELSYSIPNDKEYQYQQHYLNLIGYEYAYNNNYDGSDVTIAIIDSGIVADHEDLNYDNILQGYNYASTNIKDMVDRTGHGTFITGIIGAVTDNHRGIVGITPNVKILPLKCFDTSQNTNIRTVIKCMEKAIELDVDVINLSFYTEINVKEFQDIINKAIDKGIIIVAASGNDNSSKEYYPASYDNVVSVNSVSINKIGLEVEKSIKSNDNNKVTISAPGNEILSLSFTNQKEYRQSSGTSYATAVVSSLAVILKQNDKSITANEFIELLKITSTDYGAKGYDYTYGYGVVNFKECLIKFFDK